MIFILYFIFCFFLCSVFPENDSYPDFVEKFGKEKNIEIDEAIKVLKSFDNLGESYFKLSENKVKDNEFLFNCEIFNKDKRKEIAENKNEFLKIFFKIEKKYCKNRLEELLKEINFRGDDKRLKNILKGKDIFFKFREDVLFDKKKVEKAIEFSKESEIGIKKLNEVVFKRNREYIKYLKTVIFNDSYKRIEKMKKELGNDTLDKLKNFKSESDLEEYKYEFKLQREYIDSTDYKSNLSDKFKTLNYFLYRNFFEDPEASREKINPAWLISKNSENREFKEKDYKKLEKLYVSVFKIFKNRDYESYFKENNKDSFLYEDIFISSLFSKYDNFLEKLSVKDNELYNKIKLNNEILKNYVYKNVIFSYFSNLYKDNKIDKIYKKENFLNFKKEISEIIEEESKKFFKFIFLSKKRIENFSDKLIEKKKNELLELTESHCVQNGMYLDKGSVKNLEKNVLEFIEDDFLIQNEENTFFSLSKLELISDFLKQDIYLLKNKIDDLIKDKKDLLNIDKKINDILYLEDEKGFEYKNLHEKYFKDKKFKNNELKDEFLKNLSLLIYGNENNLEKFSIEDKDKIISLIQLKFDISIANFAEEKVLKMQMDKIKELKENLENKKVNDLKNKEQLENSSKLSGFFNFFKNGTVNLVLSNVMGRTSNYFTRNFNNNNGFTKFVVNFLKFFLAAPEK